MIDHLSEGDLAVYLRACELSPCSVLRAALARTDAATGSATALGLTRIIDRIDDEARV
ncbi:MAG: hypothetical protein WA317_21565 [Mycobacterium sp.]|uniref:hypothetical protein n=1 Tax=Mycobacterium sp. TaxID=1785 RepID=UPI003CC5A1E8